MAGCNTVLVLVTLIATNKVLAHNPAFGGLLPEDYGTFDSGYAQTRDNSLERLTAMRDIMAEYNIDAYIVPTADAHNSGTLAPTDARRLWLSGFDGAGTVVVTQTKALVWTDSRYFTQFEIQANTEYFTLMRQGIDLSIQSWLVHNMEAGSAVGIDPTTYTRTAWTPLERALNAANVSLVPEPQNLVDLARKELGEDPPPRPNNPLIILNVSYTAVSALDISGYRLLGNPSNNKLSALRDQMTERGAAALILTALDEIAYTLNLRGSDVPFNPVFFSYLVIRNDGVASPNNTILFWGNGSLASDIQSHLTSEGTEVTVMPYEDIFSYIKEVLVEELPENSAIWLSQDASHAIFLNAETNGNAILSTLSPVSLMKCIKNKVELQGFRSAHIKDGIAMVRGLRWVEEQVAAGEIVSEMDFSRKLEQLRREEVDSHGPSFATIAGSGPNGAIIHYRPPQVGSRIIGRDDMLLVDSGGQYKDGTTDITRTRHMSASPTSEQIQTFTRVMKGQIMLGTSVFPTGTVGHTLESFARRALWDVGLNYAHGTGHGIGHFLHVHEGPSWILSGPSPTDPGIVPGMIFSNEPGYYEVNEYGIRHEDVMEVIELDNTSNHIKAQGLVGNFSGAGALGFNYLSFVPHQTACMDKDLLTEFEIKFINDYHAKVLATLGPILQERELIEDFEWLQKECKPINRAAILYKSSPFLLLGVFSLWFTS